jgi:hypothetical protein
VYNRVKAVAVVCVVLLLGFAFCSLVSFDGDGDVVSGSALPGWGPLDTVTGTENVTWDFYVVAGVNTSSPPMPSPAPQPPGFNFTVAGGGYKAGYGGTGPGPVTGGFDYGKVTWRLVQFYEGPLKLISEHGWVKINITNLLGEDMVITNITAEVTNGTETLDYPAPGAWIPETLPWIGNHTLVWFDALDLYADECDYYTGVAEVSGMDSNPLLTWTDAHASNFTGPTLMPTGPLTLVGPDSGGDAAATGHVAPILLRNGETFTEYFGVQLFGNATSGTKIYGTITLTLTYRKVITPSPLDVVDVTVSPTEAYNTETVKVNVTMKNTGTSPISFNVSLYGFTRLYAFNITHWAHSTWEQVGTTQTITSLAAGATTSLIFSWELTCAPTTGLVPAKAIAVSVYNTTHIYYDEHQGQVRVRLWGDVNGDGRISLIDVGKCDLVYSEVISCPVVEPPPECIWCDLNGDGYLRLDDIGKLDLIYSGVIRLPACPP